MRNNIAARITPSPSHPPPSKSGSAVQFLLPYTSLPNGSDLDPGQRRGRVPDERLCHLWIGVLWKQLAVIQQGPARAPPEALRQRLWRGGLGPGRKARLQVGAPVAGVAGGGMERLPPAVWGRGLRRDLGVLPLEVAPAARSAGQESANVRQGTTQAVTIAADSGWERNENRGRCQYCGPCETSGAVGSDSKKRQTDANSAVRWESRERQGVTEAIATTACFARQVEQ